MSHAQPTKNELEHKNADLEAKVKELTDEVTALTHALEARIDPLAEPLPSYPNYLDPALVVFSVAAIRDRINDYPYSEKEFDAVAESFAGQAVRLAQKIQAKVNEINSPPSLPAQD